MRVNGKAGKRPCSYFAWNIGQHISFAELRYCLEALGFAVRIKGDHFIYTKPEVVEIINLQPLGAKAKAYQVKQVRTLILKYKLAR